MAVKMTQVGGIPVRIWLNQPKRGLELVDIHPHDHPELAVNKALTDFRDARDGDGAEQKVDFHLTMAVGLTSFDASSTYNFSHQHQENFLSRFG